MRPHLRYLRYVLRHKWFVLLAGLRVRAPLWRLLIHDWTKFLPCEWTPYVRKFYGAPPALNPCYFSPQWRQAEAEAWKARMEQGFDRAWLHHQRANPHHWQYWLLMPDTAPAYPRYCITSMDGGLVHHALTEYVRDYDGKGPHPETADFTNCLADDGSDENQERYRMVKRCCDSANARRPRALPMPEAYVREMVADWMGAGRAITGRWDVAEWYKKNRDNMVLHPDTRTRVEALLREAA